MCSLPPAAPIFLIKQVGHQRRQPLIVAFRPARFDREIAVLGVTGLLETGQERRAKRLEVTRSRTVDEAEAGRRHLLREYARRTRRSGTQNKPEKFPPPQHALSPIAATTIA